MRRNKLASMAAVAIAVTAFAACGDDDDGGDDDGGTDGTELVTDDTGAGAADTMATTPGS